MHSTSSEPSAPRASSSSILSAVVNRDHMRRRPVSVVLIVIFLIGTIAVIAAGKPNGPGDPGYRVSGALVWGFGFCVSGMLLGFLFAIPRILPAGTVIASAKAEDGDAAAGKASGTQTTLAQSPRDGQSEINSNLVEVSDWLTKIIVGVGLVELKFLPEAAQSVTAFVAPSIGLTPEEGAPVVGGIMLFYSVHGFLIGYLLTRIYLAMILKWADNQVISQTPMLRLPGGDTISTVDMIGQLQSRVDDVQKSIVKIVPQDQEEAVAEAAPASFSTPRILWVDDRPENNALLIDSLKRSRVDIEPVYSTSEALQLINANPARYDLVISDMGRYEDGKGVPDAGVILTKELSSSHPDLPVLIFCSRDKKETFGALAMSVGARLVTTSGTTLLRTVSNIIRASGKGPGLG